MPTYPTYKFTDIASLIRGVSYDKSVVSTSEREGYIPILRANNIQKDLVLNDLVYVPSDFVKEEQMIRKGDIVLAMSSGSKDLVGKSAQADKDINAAFGTFCGLIRAKENIDSKFLGLYFQTQEYRNFVSYQSKGVNICNLKKKDIESLQIPLPPLPTQQAIVARIEALFAELDKAAEHLRTAQQQLKTYRQAVLKAAFEGCDSYEKITNCFDVTGGLTKNSQREKFPIKMPYLRVANVYYNRLDLSEIKEIGVQESEIKDKLLKKDDLLFVEGNGSKEQIGRVAVWNGSIENCLHQNHIIKSRPLGTMLSKFALYYFISDFGREQILRVASSTSGLYTLSTEKVRNLNVPACPTSDQHRIVQEIESRLLQAEAAEASIAEALQKTEALRQSILKKAFSGELV